uniref:Uncharacterized protein n=1 Tax=viral metagenome TaxID=1070528 RepID=A0A6M3L942_9ZZZZ
MSKYERDLKFQWTSRGWLSKEQVRDLTALGREIGSRSNNRSGRDFRRLEHSGESAEADR